jgi:hypothetical protein
VGHPPARPAAHRAAAARGRRPITNAHRKLGAELKGLRERSSATLRDIEVYSSGHLSNVENGYVTPSPTLIEQYAQRFGGDLSRLQALRDSVAVAAARKRSDGREGIDSQALVPAPLDSRNPGEVLRQYQSDLSDTTYLLDEHGLVSTIKVSRELRARVDGAQLYYGVHYHPTDTGRGVLTVTDVDGCEVDEVVESASGLLEVWLRLPRPLEMADERPVACGYRVAVRSDVPMPALHQHRVTERHQLIRIGAVFDRRRLPDRVWTFEAPIGALARRDPDPGSVLRNDPDGHYVKDFPRPIYNWSYGLGWRWAA